MKFAASLLASVAAIAMVVTSAGAQQPAPETLEDAFKSASMSNPVLNEVRSNLLATRQALPAAWADALPQISATVTANHNDRSERNFGSFVQQQKEYWLAGVTTSWMIYGSGRVSAATAEARARIAEATAQYQRATQEVLLNVAKAYAEVIVARETKSAQERGLENLQEQLRYVQANNRQGFLTTTDVAQAEARVQQALASLAAANAQVIAAEESYLRLVGHRPPALAPVPAPAGLPADLGAAQSQASEHSPQVLAAAARLKSSEAAIDVAASSGRLRVSLESNNSTFRRLNPETGGRQTDDLLALRVSVPIYSGGATLARTRSQRALRDSARYALQDAQDAVTEQVATAWAQAAGARAGLTSQGVRVEATELAQRGMKREQLAGLRAVIDVLNQEQELLAARVDLARSRRDAAIADYELAAAVGMLSDGSDPVADAPRENAPSDE